MSVLVTSKTPELSRPGIVFSNAAAAVTADSRVPPAASHPGLHAIKPGHHLLPPLFPPRLSAMKLALATLALLATAAASGYGGRVGKPSKFRSSYCWRGERVCDYEKVWRARARRARWGSRWWVWGRPRRRGRQGFRLGLHRQGELLLVPLLQV